MRRSDRGPNGARVPFSADPSVRRLTPREREVAILVATGLKDAQIARHLGINPATVGNYVLRVLRRLELANREEIVGWVSARGAPDDLTGRLRRVDDARSA
jgi:DNA-binding CsgD family transcriptional regulator